MKKHRTDFSESLEDYLEAIHMLGGVSVRSVDIATQIGVSKASVNHAINALIQNGYVDKEPYGNITLTENGLAFSKRVLRKHLIIKQFLIEVLGVDAVRADDEACGIEHHISEDTIDRLERLIPKK